ncbi:SDR family NAD(P)-dependent oxidoreductase [Devosia sp. A449]
MTMLDSLALPPMPSFRLDGRRALITGASRGIGFAAAAAMAEAGAHVTLCGRSAADLTLRQAAIVAAGCQADILPLDITDIAAMRAGVAAAGPFDILLSNAATNRIKAFGDVSVDDFDALFAVNVRAAYFVAQAVADRLRRAGQPGSIIQMSSQLGHVGAANRSLYATSKFAIEGLTKALAVELGPDQIRVNAVAPTFIDTPLTRSYGLDEAAMAQVRAKIKLGRIGRVEDVTGAILFLASDASALVTGTSLLVDGGWTAE